jgi:hypothetical protein
MRCAFSVVQVVSEIDDDVYDRSDLAKDVVAFTPTEVRPILPTDRRGLFGFPNLLDCVLGLQTLYIAFLGSGVV